MIAPLLTMLLGQSRWYMWFDNDDVHRRLSAFQATDVVRLRVHLGATLPHRERDLVVSDLPTIRGWKVALTKSLRRQDLRPPAPGEGVRSDYVRFDLRDGRHVSYLLYGPDQVGLYWGPAMHRLYDASVAKRRNRATSP